MEARVLVRLARARAKMTQRELASEAGVSQAMVARIESGAVDPRASTLDRILAAAGYDASLVRRGGDGVDLGSVRRSLALPADQRMMAFIASNANALAFMRGIRHVDQPAGLRPDHDRSDPG